MQPPFMTPTEGLERYLPDALAGTWVNSDPEPRGIVELSLDVGTPVPTARVVGRGPHGPVDWGEAAARRVYAAGPASGVVAGCLLDYDFGFARAHLQVQLKLGVAVVGSYLWLGEEAGGGTGFLREFLGRLPPGARAASPFSDEAVAPVQAADLAAALPSEVDPEASIVTGHWLPTVPVPRVIAELDIEEEGPSRLALEIRGGGEDSPAWGRESAELFACLEEDAVPSVCLLAGYELPDARIELQIRQNKGILAVTSFTGRRQTGGDLDTVARELFYRGGDSDRRART